MQAIRWAVAHACGFAVGQTVAWTLPRSSAGATKHALSPPACIANKQPHDRLCRLSWSTSTTATLALSPSGGNSSSNIQARRRQLLLPWSANIIVPTSRAAYDLDPNVSSITRHDYHMSAKTCILSQLPMSFGAPQEYSISNVANNNSNSRLVANHLSPRSRD